MNYDLSVIVAGIRIDKWNDLYASIEQSTKRSFEVIFVGPEFPPLELQNCPNVMFIRDFGSPTRCRQIGLQFAIGAYSTWIADDCPFLPGAIDGMFDMLSKMGSSEKNIVSGKYYEGRHIQGSDELHLSDAYYCFGFHATLDFLPFVKDKLLVNIGLVNTNYLKSLGGWDCLFEATAFADADLAIRFQMDGANVVLTHGCVASAEWNSEGAGDHGAVHYATAEHDFPLFCSFYEDSQNCYKRVKVPICNWVDSQIYWNRRYSTMEQI